MLVLTIAWRSILRHKTKSIIIGSILFLGALLMTLGNATAIGMRRGVEENIVRSFTGHIILVSDEETKDNVLFTPMAKPLKILKDYDRIRDVLLQQEFVRDFIPMTRGGVAILGGQQMSFLLTFGCNFDDFQRVFDSPIRTVEGELLKNGDHGLLVNVEGRKTLHRTHSFWLVPEGAGLNIDTLSEEARKEVSDLVIQDRLALEGFGEPNSTNKEMPVKGIVRFRSLNTAMRDVSFMDIESYREIFGYYTARDLVEELPAEQDALLAADEDDLFAGGDIYSSGTAEASVSELEEKIRTEPAVTRKIDLDTAAFNYISVLLKPGENLNASVEKLKRVAQENGLPVRVLSWKTASGQVAQVADILQAIVAVFVVLLFFVAVVIIMNTLSMNALERTEEFGMMRAVGARKGFITRMFLAETFSLSFVFGGAGILIGVIVTWIIRPLRIGAGESEIFELLFGGEVFQPTLGVAGLLVGILSLGIVTVLAVIYPLLVARRITPLDAINRH
jgi:ABC-type lipoprotein release transport system permease subunit